MSNNLRDILYNTDVTTSIAKSIVRSSVGKLMSFHILMGFLFLLCVCACVRACVCACVLHSNWLILSFVEGQLSVSFRGCGVNPEVL